MSTKNGTKNGRSARGEFDDVLTLARIDAGLPDMTDEEAAKYAAHKAVHSDEGRQVIACLVAYEAALATAKQHGLVIPAHLDCDEAVKWVDKQVANLSNKIEQTIG